MCFLLFSLFSTFFFFFFVFFFNDTATTEIYTLSLHDALPIWPGSWTCRKQRCIVGFASAGFRQDRKSTRLNSSHVAISYAVFCLKKKKKKKTREKMTKNELNAERSQHTTRTDYKCLKTGVKS